MKNGIKEDILSSIEEYLKNSHFQKTQDVAKEERKNIKDFLMEMKCRYAKKGVYYFSDPYFYIELIGERKQAILYIYEYLKRYLEIQDNQEDGKIILKEKVDKQDNIYIKKEFKVNLNKYCLFNLYERYWRIEELEKIKPNSKEEELYLELKKKYPLKTVGIRIDIGKIEIIKETKRKNEISGE